MELLTIWTIVASVIVAASVILKVVAPLTKTKRDDKVLSALLYAIEKLSLNTKL